MPDLKQEPHYDIFISYRRETAGELALLLQRELARNGLQAFLDRDLTRGFFDDQLRRRIAEAPAFLVILTSGALDRCGEEDWMRKEITEAIRTQRNIIPLQVGSFQFTPELVEKLHPEIRELSRHQTVVYSREYFDSTIEQIVRFVRAASMSKRYRLPKPVLAMTIVALFASLIGVSIYTG